MSFIHEQIVANLTEIEDERRSKFPPAQGTRSAYKIIKGQYRRAFGKRGAPHWYGGPKPHPGTNKAVLLKRQRWENEDVPSSTTS